MLRTLPAAAALLLAGLMVGCQSSRPMGDQQMSRSVMTDNATFVETSTGQGPRQVVAYTRNQQPICPECRMVSEDYFRTGVLSETVCKTCHSPIAIGTPQVTHQ